MCDISLQLSSIIHRKRREAPRVLKQDRKCERGDVISEDTMMWPLSSVSSHLSLIHAENQPDHFSRSRCDVCGCLDQPVSWGQLRGLANNSNNMQETNLIINCNTWNLPASVWWYNTKYHCSLYQGQSPLRCQGIVFG